MCVCEEAFRVCLFGSCCKIPVKTSHGKRVQRCFIWDSELLLSFTQFTQSLNVLISCRCVSAALWCRDVCVSRRSCFSVCTTVMTWSSFSDCAETVQSTRLHFSLRWKHYEKGTHTASEETIFRQVALIDSTVFVHICYFRFLFLHVYTLVI